MREIVLDTETTGRNPLDGDRIVELGCVELVNHIPTGNVFQRYLDPGRDSEPGALAVHGLTREFLAKFPPFESVADEFLAFIGDSPLVIHNAEFDLGFVNAELVRLDLPILPSERAIDTLRIARRKFPGAPASLNDLCRRFSVDLSKRSLHGALLDAELLAAVYLELIGGRQQGMTLEIAGGLVIETVRVLRAPRPHAPSEAELAAHAAFVAQIPDALWRQ